MPKKARGKKRHREDGEGVWQADVKDEGGENAFVAYYAAQKIVSGEEWDEVMATMKASLPVTLRFEPGETTTEKQFLELAKTLSPKRLEWIERGWQLSVDRTTIRKSEDLCDLHEFLKTHESAGAITRQEAVSMVPPLFLDVVPGHRVYDACAAPGSKTSQLVEKTRTSGFVLANDEKLPRTHTLVHQLKRLGSPSWLVTHADARSLPNIFPMAEKGAAKVEFDRVLCDVPCSSDGTMRKMPTVLARWKCRNGNALHPLQLAIAKRSAQLLAPAGRLVYSTCSMNPVEDEAVVAELLRSDSSLHVVDTSASLPELKRRPGLSEWVVMVDTDDGVSPCPAEDQSTMAPPTEENIKDQLKRCMRFLPHDSDTGAFFVAVLEKKNNKHERESEKTKDAVQKVVPVNKSKAAAKKALPEDAGFIQLSSVADTTAIRDFYGLSPSFPMDQVLTRVSGEAGDSAKRALFVSNSVRDLLLGSHSLRIVHAGVTVFQRTSMSSGECPTDYRVAQDGVHLLIPHMTKRIVRCTKKDFSKLLEGGVVHLDTMSVADEVRKLDVGALIFVVEDCEHLEFPATAAALVVWRSPGPYLTVYCAKNELKVLASRHKASLSSK